MRLQYLLLIVLLFAGRLSFSQPLADTSEITSILLDVNARQTNFARIGMVSLNGWAVSNIVVGSIAFDGAQGKDRYFHQMNVFWNVVNLSIGIPGLIGTYKDRPTDFESIYKYQKRAENVYLFNMGLDLGYIASGWALDNFGKTRTGDLGDRFKGYGNSLVMQGSYLFLHDLVLYFLYKSNNGRLDIIWKNVTIKPAGIGVVIELN